MEKYNAFSVGRPGEYRHEASTLVQRLYRPTDEAAIQTVLQRSGPLRDFEYIARFYSDKRDDGSTTPIFVKGSLPASVVVGLPIYIEHSYPEGVKLPQGDQLDKSKYGLPTRGSVPIGKITHAYDDIVPGDVYIKVSLNTSGLSQPELSDLKNRLLTQLKDMSMGYLVAKNEDMKRLGTHRGGGNYAIPRVDGTSALFVEASLTKKGDVAGAQLLLVKASNDEPVVTEIRMNDIPHETQPRLNINNNNNNEIQGQQPSQQILLQNKSVGNNNNNNNTMSSTPSAMQIDQQQTSSVPSGGLLQQAANAAAAAAAAASSGAASAVAPSPASANPIQRSSPSGGNVGSDPMQSQQSGNERQGQNPVSSAGSSQTPILSQTPSSSTLRRDEHMMQVDQSQTGGAGNQQQQQRQPMNTIEQQQQMMHEIQRLVASTMGQSGSGSQNQQPQQQQQQQQPQQQQSQPPQQQQQQQQQGYEDLKKELSSLKARMTFMGSADTVAHALGMNSEMALNMLTSLPPDYAQALIASANSIYSSKNKIEGLGQTLQQQQQTPQSQQQQMQSPSAASAAAASAAAPPATGSGQQQTQSPTAAAATATSSENMAALQRAAGTSFVQKRPASGQDFQPQEKVQRNYYADDFDAHRGQQQQYQPQQQQQQQQQKSPVDEFMRKVENYAKSMPGSLYQIPGMRGSLQRGISNL